MPSPTTSTPATTVPPARNTPAPPNPPATTIAPVPTTDYNPANQPRRAGRTPTPALTDALSRLAGTKAGAPPVTPEPAASPGPAVTPGLDTTVQPAPQPAVPPSQSAQPTFRPAAAGAQQPSATNAPPANVPPQRFIPADEQEPAAPLAAPIIPEPPAPDPTLHAAANKQLRDAYEKLKTDFTARAAEGDLTKKQLAEFQAKAKGYEERIAALATADQRAKDLEARLLTTDEQLRIANYLQHPEFHEKYTRPVAESMQAAYALVKDLTVDDGSTIRPGSESDFQAVLAQPNTTLAFNKAKELFGDLANQVVEARQRVKTAQLAQSRAVDEAGVRSAKWLEERQASEAQARLTARTSFEAAERALAARFPQLYLPKEGDAEEAAARASGESEARLVVLGSEEPIAPDVYLQKVSKVYHRAAAHPLLALRLQRAEAELTELRAFKAAYDNSTPDAQARQSVSGENPSAAIAADPRAAMRKSLEEVANRSRR